MKQKEFEQHLLSHAWTDQEFYSFLEAEKLEGIEFEILDEEVKKEREDFSILEDSTLEYMESLCSYDPDLLSDTREALLATEMKKLLYYAFFYLKEGISYMDLVQEGIVGLLKGIDFSSSYLEHWAIREMFLKVQSEFRDLKFELKNFLRKKREDLEQGHSQEHHHGAEGDCSCAHHHEEGEECLDYEEEELRLEQDKTALLEKLLKNNKAIDEMEKIMEEQLDIRCLKYRLYAIEVEVLNYYFGLLTDRRYSIYEIEKKFSLQDGQAQTIFETALYKLSTVKGKMEL